MVRLRSPAPKEFRYSTELFHMGEFPSGQRGQTVNLLSLTSLVRIQLPPPKKEHRLNRCSFFVGEAIRPANAGPHTAAAEQRMGQSAFAVYCVTRRSTLPLYPNAEQLPQSALRVATDSFPHQKSRIILIRLFLSITE